MPYYSCSISFGFVLMKLFLLPGFKVTLCKKCIHGNISTQRPVRSPSRPSLNGYYSKNCHSYQTVGVHRPQWVE